MTKLNKILIFAIAVLIAGSICYVLAPSGSAGTKMVSQEEGAAHQLAGITGAIGEAIQQMINRGSIPENITFTGAQSSDDVFNFDREHNSSYRPLNELFPPQEACSPRCSNWKFLPASKKDQGWYVYDIGTTAADIIAFLPGITPAVCSEVQKGFGYKSPVPPKQASASFDPAKSGVYLPQGGATTIKSQDDALDGQYEGCFDNHVGDGPSEFSYYSVLYGQ